jgi:hypothetical protein
MNTLFKSVAGAVAVIAATTTQASAQITFWLLEASSRHHGGRSRHMDGNHHTPRGHGGGHGRGHEFGSGGGSGGGAPSAPEIDVSQAAAALVIVLVAFLLIREIYLRQRQPA